MGVSQDTVTSRPSKARIIELVRRGAEEIVTEEELGALAERLAAGGRVNAYIGFEPSGSVHLGWVLVANKITDLVEAGFHFKIFLADWHAMINDKLGGDLEKIRACAHYMEHCFKALGVPVERLEFVYANDLAGDAKYWARVLNVAKATSLARIRRSMDIMGRSADEGEKDFSKFIYPAMQVADIFHMDIDLAYGGLDQRHAHMLARDVAKKLGAKPPVALHTPLLPGLKAQGRMDPIEAKMSKSDPDSGIMIHDTPQDLVRKMKKAQCPQGETVGNPVLDLMKHVVFPTLWRRAEKMGERPGPFVIDRPEKFGGPLTFADYAALEHAFVHDGLHPMDLKSGAVAGLVQVLQPVYDYFAANAAPLETMRTLKATR